VQSAGTYIGCSHPGTLKFEHLFHPEAEDISVYYYGTFAEKLTETEQIQSPYLSVPSAHS
jgi:hypothetical protein